MQTEKKNPKKKNEQWLMKQLSEPENAFRRSRNS